MISTGVTPDVVDAFVVKQCALNGLDEKTAALLKASIFPTQPASFNVPNLQAKVWNAIRF